MKKISGANVYNAKLCLPRMSWSAANLHNLYQRSLGPPSRDTSFTKTSKTLYQQQWLSKKLIRGYHGDWIQEKRFKKSFLPLSLPAIIGTTQNRLVRSNSNNASASSSSSASKFRKGKGRDPDVEQVVQKGKVPLGSLMLSEVEARLDVLVFRACFAPSAYAARSMVVGGKVKLNGKKETNPNVKLKPGDIFTVEPDVIPMLQPQRKAPSPPPAEPTQGESEEAQAAPASTPSIPANRPFNLPDFAAPFIFIPSYLEVSFPTCTAIYVRHPTARPGYSEIPTPYEADGEVMRLAWEWYQKAGRGKRRLPHKRIAHAIGSRGNDFARRGMDTSHIVEL